MVTLPLGLSAFEATVRLGGIEYHQQRNQPSAPPIGRQPRHTSAGAHHRRWGHQCHTGRRESIVRRQRRGGSASAALSAAPLWCSAPLLWSSDLQKSPWVG